MIATEVAVTATGTLVAVAVAFAPGVCAGPGLAFGIAVAAAPGLPSSRAAVVVAAAALSGARWVMRGNIEAMATPASTQAMYASACGIRGDREGATEKGRA